MSDVQITVTENGPYRIKGPITVLDPAGNPFETIGGQVFLCRCGGSSTKPFCDGTHSKIGFIGAAAAVAEADADS
jgi:CDGSH-type Zn-finger protein